MSAIEDHLKGALDNMLNELSWWTRVTKAAREL